MRTDFSGGDRGRDERLSTALLQQEDNAELDAFLALHAHSSMYLRADLRRATGRATFAIARQHGQIVAAAAHMASGMVVLQAPVGAADVAATALHHSGRRLAGFYGPMAQVHAAHQAMGLDGMAVLKDTVEDLFALSLSYLRLPTILAEQTVRCRVAGDADFDLLVAWRTAFRLEAMGDVAGAQLDETCRADIAGLLPAGSLFILEGPQALACCSFNARLPGVVQIGNVWTPPELRGHGYARAVVAGALAIAAEHGTVTTILSTGRKNVAAQAAYRSLGFHVVGDYATLTISPEAQLPDF